MAKKSTPVDKRILVLVIIAFLVALVVNPPPLSLVGGVGTTASGEDKDSFKVTPKDLVFKGKPNEVLTQEIRVFNNLPRESLVSFSTSSGTIIVKPSEITLPTDTTTTFLVSVALPFNSGKYSEELKVRRDLTQVYVTTVGIEIEVEKVSVFDRIKTFVGI